MDACAIRTTVVINKAGCDLIYGITPLPSIGSRLYPLPSLPPIISLPSADHDIRIVHLYSNLSEAPIEIEVRSAISHAIDGAQLRGYLLKDTLQIRDPVGVV